MPLEPYSPVQLFIAEFVGTMLLILLGNGVVANVVLKNTKGENAGWIVIALGWGMAVFVAVFCVANVSGAHINPAVTLGLAVAGKLEWNLVPIYVIAQFGGAILGALLVWVMYVDHFSITKDPESQMAAFCTSPAIRRPLVNLVSEIIGTTVLVYAVLHIMSPEGGLGSLDALPVGLLVLAIGLSLGGTTGYAINPARDLSPRLMHQILPIPGKRDSDWSYAWIPVVGPIIGGALAALCYYAVG